MRKNVADLGFILGVTFTLGLGVVAPGRVAWAKAAKAGGGAPAAGKAVNACGCYADSTGKCFCGKKGKCVCPGECEPKGCEEKRAKQIQKEIAAETKKAAEAEKKQRKIEASNKTDKEKTGAKAAPKEAKEK